MREALLKTFDSLPKMTGGPARKSLAFGCLLIILLGGPGANFTSPAVTSAPTPEVTLALDLTRPDDSPEFLSDLRFISITNGSGPVETDMSNGLNGARDGSKISLSGVKYDKGLGVQAPSEVRYCLGGNYAGFSADVGVDDEAPPGASAEFQVWADRELLYESGAMTKATPAKNVRVNLTGKNELRLMVNGGAANLPARADWAGGRLVRLSPPPAALAPGATVFLSDLPFRAVANGLGPVEKDQSNGGEDANDGGKMAIKGVAYTKGLGVRAESEVRFCMGGRFAFFAADVGLDDSAEATGAAVFKVFADDLLLYDSGKVTSGTPAGKINLGVLGKNELRLVVAADVVGAGGGPPADWANARLVAADPAPAVIGRWSEPETLPFVSVHSNLLPNGKILIWQATPAAGAALRVWNLPDKSFTPAPLPTKTPANNLFCSGHSFLPDGRLLVTGGHVKSYFGTSYTNIYDFSTNTWSSGADMNDARWYPTNCTLSNGEVLVIGGSIGKTDPDPPAMNTLPQVWQVSGGYRSLTSAVLRLPLYPWMHLAPDGRVFNSGPNETARYLDTAGNGKWSVVADSKFGFRDYGSSVMYDDGKVIIIGGGNSPTDGNRPTNTAEMIDLNAASPSWRDAGRMAYARRQHNATLLPDGKILVTGGTSGPGFNDEVNPVYAAEIWDPETNTWTTVASMKTPRLYHSTALLLPDGRVMSAGGGFAVPYHDYPSVEFYTPPYLFNGARPSITAAPESVGYGQTFLLETPDKGDIKRVTWVRLPSVTHSFDQNQRINRLSFTKAAKGLMVSAPASKNLCPPGHYMIFIINNAGAPSVARIIKIR